MFDHKSNYITFLGFLCMTSFLYYFIASFQTLDYTIIDDKENIIMTVDEQFVYKVKDLENIIIFKSGIIHHGDLNLTLNLYSLPYILTFYSVILHRLV